MTDLTREIFDFAQMEKESTGDLEEMISKCSLKELNEIFLVGANLTKAALLEKESRRKNNK